MNVIRNKRSQMPSKDVQRAAKLTRAAGENLRLLHEVTEQVTRTVVLSRENARLREEAESLKRLIMQFTDEIVPQVP